MPNGYVWPTAMLEESPRWMCQAVEHSQNAPKLEAQFIKRYNLSQRPLKRLVVLVIITIVLFYTGWDLVFLGLDHALSLQISLTRVLFCLPALILLYAASHSYRWSQRFDLIVLLADVLIGLSILINIYQYGIIGEYLNPNGMLLWVVASYLTPGFFWHQKLIACLSISLLFIFELFWLSYPAELIQSTIVYTVLFNLLCALNVYSFDQKVRSNYYKNQLLKEIAGTDKLTGLANRYQFEENLDQLLEDAQEEDQGLALAFVDIDWFKQYNDVYGHIKGDGCLVAVANALYGSKLSEEDLVVRFGGEEFILVRNHINKSELAAWGDTILSEVSKLKLEHERSPLEIVTVSAGIAWYDPNSLPHRGDLMHSADQALYKAKTQGRNHAVIYPTENEKSHSAMQSGKP